MIRKQDATIYYKPANGVQLSSLQALAKRFLFVIIIFSQPLKIAALLFGDRTGVFLNKDYQTHQSLSFLNLLSFLLEIDSAILPRRKFEPPLKAPHQARRRSINPGSFALFFVVLGVITTRLPSPPLDKHILFLPTTLVKTSAVSFFKIAEA